MKEYDILIVSHKKDFFKIPFLIESIKKNIIGYSKIHIIANDFLDLKDKDVVIHYEKDIINLNLSEIKWRSNWIFQQILKLLQNVTKEWYLVIDSDVYINKKINPFLNNKPNFFITNNNQYHQPYFNFLKKLNIYKKSNNTYISDMMLFNQKLILDIFEKNNILLIDDILSILCDNNENMELSEFELYGNFIETYYPDLYNRININCKSIGKGVEGINNDFWDIKSIQKFINENINGPYDLLAYHSWI